MQHSGDFASSCSSSRKCGERIMLSSIVNPGSDATLST